MSRRLAASSTRAPSLPRVFTRVLRELGRFAAASLQARTEHRVEQLNTQIYGAAWAWLPVPLWLSLVDPESDGSELERLAREWGVRAHRSESNSTHQAQRVARNTRRRRVSLPIFQTRS